MVLISIRDPEKLTLEEAEQLRASGAYLEMEPSGWICVYEGGTDLEGDTDYLG